MVVARCHYGKSSGKNLLLFQFQTKGSSVKIRQRALLWRQTIEEMMNDPTKDDVLLERTFQKVGQVASR